MTPAAALRAMRAHLEDMPDGLKHLFDAISITALLGSVIDVLPAIATLLTIIWTVIRIFETTTVQRLLRRKEPVE